MFLLTIFLKINLMVLLSKFTTIFHFLYPTFMSSLIFEGRSFEANTRDMPAPKRNAATPKTSVTSSQVHSCRVVIFL